MRKASIFIIYLLLASYLNVGFVGVMHVATADGNYVFYDDFNDNSLDTTKWTEDVVGSGNSYTEANGEAQFITYGHGGWDNGHATLVSRPIEIDSWSSITLSGNWKFTDPETAEMLVKILDADSDSFVAVHYISWPSDQISYRYPGKSITEDRTIPRSYVPFKIVLYKDHFEFWESGTLVKTVYTNTMENVTRFQVVIGGWDYSAYYSHMCFDDIAVQYTPGRPAEEKLRITIYSPKEQTYNTTTVDLNVTANKPVDEWRYSLNGGKNVTFIPNTTITAKEGENHLVVYALAGDESATAQVDFYVNLTKDTTPPGTVENLTHEVGMDYIHWTWDNPKDGDFEGALVYIDGKYQGETTDEEWELDGLSPGETHEIGILTKDTSGNVNTTWVNDTATTPVPAETVYVNESGWWYEGGTLNPSETPLQDGIDASLENGTVVVLAGTYPESVEIDKPLTVETDEGAEVRGDGSYWDDGMKPVFYVESNNVTLRGFTINSSVSNIGVWIDDAGNCTVEGNTVVITEGDEDVRYGVYLSYGGNNTVRNNGISVSGFQGIGIYVYEEEKESTVNGNMVRVTGDGADGILVFEASSVVHDNDVAISGIGGNSGYALYLYTAGDSSVHNNDLSTNLSEENAWAIGVVDEFNGSLSSNVINGVQADATCPGNCMLRGVSPGERPAPSEGYGAVGEYLDVSMDSWVYLTFHYGDDALAGLEEDTLRVWLFNENWTLEGTSDHQLDTSKNLVGANLTQSGIFAPLAQEEADTTPPSLSFVSPTPENGSLVDYSHVVFYIASNENLSSVTLELDGVNHTMAGSGKDWSYEADVPDGGHTFRAYGQDLAGNNGTSEERSFEVDTEGPAYSNVGQNPDGIPPGGSVQIYAFWSDLHLMKAELYSNITGSWEETDEAFFEGTEGWSNFSISMDEPGLYCWYIVAIDRAGNTNQTPAQCFEVYSPPEITSYSPESPVESYVGDSVTFTLTANQPVNVTWYIGDAEVYREENVLTSSYTNSTAQEGEYSVTAVAENENGSDSVSWTWYVYPKQGFSIGFTEPTPEDGAMLNVRSVTVNVTSSRDLDNATLEWNGVNYTMGGSGKSWWAVMANLADGAYTFRVYGSADGVVNRTEARTVEVDATPPELLDAGQSSSEVLEGDSLRIFARWSDSHLEDAVLWSNTTLADGVFIWEKTPLEIVDGWSNWTIETSADMAGKTFCWYIVANDTFGNENEMERLCFKVEERLRIVSFSPEAGEVTVWDNESASFSVALNKVANVSWFVNGSEVLSDEGLSSEYTNSSLIPGVWNVSVTASNGNGEVSHWWLMRVGKADTTPPELWFVPPTPENGSFVNTSWATINVTASEDLLQAVLELDGVNHTMTCSGREWKYESDLPDGTHTIVVYGEDMAGNWGRSEKRTFTVDTKPPKGWFEAPTPENGSFTGSGVVTFKLISDEELEDVTLYIDGKDYEMSGGGTEWTLELTLPDGVHTFHAEFHDLADNFNRTGEMGFMIDTTPPKLAFLPPTPKNGSITGESRVTFVLASDEPLSSATLHLDGNDYEMAGSGTEWSLTLDLGDGIHEFYAKASDLAGNSNSTAPVSFEVDTTPPVLTLVPPTPENGSLLMTSTITVNVSSNENLSSAVLEIDGREVPMSGEGTEWSLTLNVSDGGHELRVYGYDRAGNLGSSPERSFEVDTVPPVIDLVEPTPEWGSTLNRSIVTFSISSSEPLRAAVLVLDGEEYPMAGSGESWSVTLMVGDGHHGFHVIGTDLAGNNGTSEKRVFTVDTTAPSIEFISPTPRNGSLLNTHSVVVSIVSDEDLEEAVLELDGVNYTMKGIMRGWYLSLTLPDGRHRIQVYGTDTVGNRGVSDWLVFTVDTTPPEATFITPTPENGSITGSSQVESRLGANEDLSAATLYLDGIDYPMTKHNSYWTVTLTVADGEHTFYAEVRDEAGNTGLTEARTFTSDTMPPLLSFVQPTPENGSLVGSRWLWIAVNSSENLSTAVLEFDGQNHTMMGGGRHWHINILASSDGKHSFRAYGTDRAGNTGASEPRVIEIDSRPPSVQENLVNLTVTSRRGELVYAKAERENVAGVLLNVTEEHPGWYEVDFNPDASTPQEGWYRLSAGSYGSGSPFFIEFNTSEVGYVIYYIVVSDSLGNWGYSSYFFLTVEDTTPPAKITQFGANVFVGGAEVWWINPTDDDFNHTELWINGTLIGNFTGEPGSISSYLAYLTVGETYNISVVPVDRYGNRGSASWRLVSVPYPSLSSAHYSRPTPENGTILPANTSNVTVSVSSEDKLGSCRIVWDGMAYSAPVKTKWLTYIDERGKKHSKLIYTCEKTFFGHLNGNHSFSAIVSDGYGHWRSLEERHVTVAWPCFEGCSLEITSPEPESNVMSLLVPINFTMETNALPVGYELVIEAIGYDARISPNVTYSWEGDKLSLSGSYLLDLRPFIKELKKAGEKGEPLDVLLIARGSCGRSLSAETAFRVCSGNERSRLKVELKDEVRPGEAVVPVVNVEDPNGNFEGVYISINGDPYVEYESGMDIARNLTPYTTNLVRVKAVDSCRATTVETFRIAVEGPPVSGDWVVNNAQSCDGREYTVNGSLLVTGSGSLELRGCKIHLLGGKVEVNGTLRVREGSLIEGSSISLFGSGGTLQVEDSELRGFRGGTFGGTASFTASHLVGNFNFSSSAVSIADSDVEGGVIASGSLSVSESVFHGGSGLKYIRPHWNSPGTLSIVNSTFRNNERGLSFVGTFPGMTWNVRNILIENNRYCGLYLEETSGQYSQQTLRNATIRHNGIGVCARGGGMRLENSAVYSNGERNFDLDLNRGWMFLEDSIVNGSRYAFIARNVGGIEIWDTNVSGSVSPYPTYFILHVGSGKKVTVTDGKASDFYAYVNGELLLKDYTVEKGGVEVRANGTLRIEDTDGIPATSPADRDASVLRNVTVEGLANSSITILNSKLENSHVGTVSREALIRGCLVNGGGLGLSTTLGWSRRNTEILEEPIGNDSAWFYSTEEPAEDWIYTASGEGMSSGEEPFYANSYKSHFTAGTEVGQFTDLYLKKVVTLDKLPVQAWLNYYAVSGVEIYVNGRKVVDKLDHEAQLSYTYGWGGGGITAHPLMELVDIAGYLRSGENVIAVHVRSPNRYPYLDLGAFKATLVVVEGMAGLTDSVVNGEVSGGSARLIIARDRINGNVGFSMYSRVLISDSAVHGSVKASGRLEVIGSNVTGDGNGRGIWVDGLFSVLINESSIEGFGEGTHLNPMGSTGSLEVYSSSIENSGVGLWVYNATVEVRGNYFMKNGRGMVLDKTAGLVRNNLIAGNGDGIDVYAYGGGALYIDHNTITGGGTGVSFRYGNGGRVMLSNNLIQDNDVGMLFNGSASVAMENNSLINAKGIHVIWNPSPMSMENTDWGGHVPVKVENHPKGIMYTANGEESEDYDILCDIGSLSLGNTVETGSDWGSSLLGAFLAVYPSEKGVVKGVVTLAGSARSRSPIVKVNYTLLYNGTEKLIGNVSPDTYEYSDFITFDMVAENLTGVGFFRFTTQNAEGTKVSAVRRVYFGNAEVKIDDFSVSHPTAVYVYRRDPNYYGTAMPYDERFANVTVTLRNTGDLMGVVKVELVLPGYIERHTGRVSMLVAVPAGMSGKFHALIPITVYDPLKMKWDPMPDELPADHRIPMDIRVYDMDGVLRDEELTEISFDLGPVFKIVSYDATVYPRSWCQHNRNKCHVKNYGLNSYTYDGDGDGNLEAAESHHFDLVIKNVGDEAVYLKSLNVRDCIPEPDPYYSNKILKQNSVTLLGGGDYTFMVDVRSKNLTRLTKPGEKRWVYGAWMPWWFDAPPRFIPPVNFSGSYLNTVYVIYRPVENDQPYGGYYTTFPINYKKTPVKALNKTFVPFTEMVGPVQVDVLGINGNKTYLRLKNTNDNVYYSYYAEGDYDMNPEGYVWYHTIPPGFEFKAIADHSREPGTVIPHYRVTVGVEYSLLFNELELIAIGAEGALKVYDIDVPLEAIVMGIVKASLKITNIVENLDFPDDKTIEEYSKSSSSPQVNNMLINDNTTVVPLTLDDFARWEKEYGMTKGYYYNLTHFSDIPMDAKIAVLTKLAKAIATDDDLQILLLETVLEVVDNDVANEIYKAVKTAQNGGPSAQDEVNAGLDEIKKQVKKQLVKYLKEQIKKQKSFQELDPKEQEKALKKSGKSIAAALDTFEKMGEWAFYNIYAVLTQPNPMSIQVLDPPANYTVKAKKMDTAIVLGGEGGNLDGWGNVSLTFGNPDVYRAEYVVPTPVTKVGPLFNGTFESMRLEISGSGNGTVNGSLRMEIRPDPRNASMVFALFRNERFASAFIAPYMAKIDSFSSEIENGTVVITATGELAALPEDREIEISMNIGRLFTNATIVRKGHYRGAVELKPAFGIDPSKVQTSVGGSVKTLTGRTKDGSLVVISSENGTPELPEITINPTTLYAGGAISVRISRPCPVEWFIANLSGSGLIVGTEGLKPGNYTLTVSCPYGNTSVEENFSVRLLPRPVVKKTASGEIVSSGGNEWIRVITSTDLYRVYLLPAGPVEGMLAVYEKPGKVEGYTVYALFNVSHPANWSVSSAALRFRIPKEWLRENNVSPEEVILLRYSGEWEEFNPLMEGEDLRYVYYKASVPGLSLFAVAKRTSAHPPETNGTTETTTTPSPTETQGTSTTETPTGPGTAGGADWPYYALIGALLVLLVVYLYRRR